MPNPALEVEDQTHAVVLIVALAEYATTFAIESESAIGAARHCLIGALGNGFEALRDPERAALIGPLVPGALMPGGARVPGTSLELDPAQAAFCTSLILSAPADGSHAAVSHSRNTDSFAAILAVADYQARQAIMEGRSPPKVRDLLAAFAKALEIHGVLAFDADKQVRVGPGAIRLVRVASTAVVTAQLGGNLGQVVHALSYACADGEMSIDADERCRSAWRDWARADAIGRAVRHACQAMGAGRSTYLTSVDLEAVDRAGKLLGAHPRMPVKLLASDFIDRLAADCQPREVAELTTSFRAAVDRYFPTRQAERIKALFAVPERLDELPVNELLAALVTNGAR